MFQQETESPETGCFESLTRGQFANTWAESSKQVRARALSWHGDGWVLATASVFKGKMGPSFCLSWGRVAVWGGLSHKC